MYLAACSQISVQKPFMEEWLMQSIVYDGGSFARAIDPDMSSYFSPIAARRLSPVVKRAIITARKSLEMAKIQKPDAIIAGTGLGCVENTEKFLSALVFNGEQFVQPTHFIQSTHNTISSQIALHLDCNAYNSTYVHRGISFESALLDAFLQCELNAIQSALVGGYDELSNDYFKMLNKIHFWKDTAFAGEGCTSFVFTKEKNENTLAEITSVKILNTNKDVIEEALEMIRLKGASALMLGCSGDERWTHSYDDFAKKIGEKLPRYYFKNKSGEYFTASGFGLYAAVQYMQRDKLDSILFYNHFQNRDHALIHIERCGN